MSDPAPASTPTADEIADEQRRLRRLRTIVDLTCCVLAQGGLTRAEGLDLVEAARRNVLELFPGKEETFEIILAPRFARLLAEFTPPPIPRKVLPFRRS